MVMSVQEIIRSVEQLPLSERELVVRSIMKTIQDNEHVQSVASIEKQHPDEWLAIIIPDGEDAYDPKRGRLIAHGPDRSGVWEQVNALPATENIFVFFNGPVAAKGFGIAFYDTDTPVTAASRA